MPLIKTLYKVRWLRNIAIASAEIAFSETAILITFYTVLCQRHAAWIKVGLDENLMALKNDLQLFIQCIKCNDDMLIFCLKTTQGLASYPPVLILEGLRNWIWSRSYVLGTNNQSKCTLYLRPQKSKAMCSRKAKQHLSSAGHWLSSWSSMVPTHSSKPSTFMKELPSYMLPHWWQDILITGAAEKTILDWK